MTQLDAAVGDIDFERKMLHVARTQLHWPGAVVNQSRDLAAR